MLIFLLLLFMPSAWADSGFTGHLQSTTDDYPYHLGPPTQDLIPYLTLELSDKHKLTKALRFQWKIYALTNLSTTSPPENLYGDIPEGFFEYKSGSTKFRLGMNTLNWGVVDVSSPSDTMNTLMIFNPMKIRKQGAPMAEAIVGPEYLNLDLAYIPVQRAAQMPSPDSRWLPREYLSSIYEPQVGTLYLPQRFQYQYTDPVTLNHALNNNFAAKLASHVDNWDFQATYFQGASNFPKIIPGVSINATTNTPTVGSLIDLTEMTYLVRNTGFGFVWAREKWIFRGETAYQATLSPEPNPSSPYLQPWSWTSVLAVETNVDIRARTLTLLAQAYYTKDPQQADNMVSSTFRLFDQTGMLGARFAYSDDLLFTLSSLYETTSQGLFWMAGFDNKWTDHIRWGLSWTNFSAAKQGLIQTYAKDSHATMDLSYFF